MRSTKMAFDDAFAHVIAEIGGDWDKWKSDLGARDRESKSSAKYKTRQELVTHWKGEMTLIELASLRPECVKSAPCLNLLDVHTAMELAVKHVFEQVSLKRELHIAGMLLRRGIARVSVAQALAWVKSEMERTGGEPDIVGHDKKTGEYIFYDCSSESPKGRRSVCYDREALESRKEHKPEDNAIDLAAAIGIRKPSSIDSAASCLAPSGPAMPRLW